MIANAKRNELLNHIGPIEIEKTASPTRVYKINNFEIKQKPVVYLMQREQRVCDNWALIFAQQLALKIKQSFVVLFFFDREEKINSRKLDFMLKGLEEVKKDLKDKNIGFKIILSTKKEFADYLKSFDTGCLVTDFTPLNEDKIFKDFLSSNLKAALYEVDSHNILPCRYVSKAQEYSAATLRAKIKILISEFLTEFPKLIKHPYSLKKPLKEEVLDFKCIEDKTVKPITWLKPSFGEAKKELDKFIKEKLASYNLSRNDPNKDVLSNMSPYLHFGQISSQRIALEILKSDSLNENKEAYLEELIVRKELADNFCFYNGNYKNTESFPLWAQYTLKQHESDVRTYEYSPEEFENAKTHDKLWNAAQMEMAKTGKMHSYMRMYWCKKILEWSKDVKIAQEIAIYLNDKYSIDGIDPNGYVGIAWSIGGVHDRAWPDRNVFGKIRYMNYEGCRRKFDVELYVNTIKNIPIV